MPPLPPNFWNEEYRWLLALLAPKLTEAAQRGARGAGAQLGLGANYRLSDADATQWAQTYTDKLLQQLGTTTENLVGAELEKFFSTPGATMGDLQDWLTPKLAGNAGRANAIAVTEVTRAYSAGQRQAYTRNGVKYWAWSCSNDELTCPRCGPLNGKIVEIGQPFAVDAKGNPVTEPPFHPRCRCWTRPHVEVEQVSNNTVVADPKFDRRRTEATETTNNPRSQVRLTPSGIPVSQAIQIPHQTKLQPPIKTALEAIDATHGDGQLPSIPVIEDTSTDSYGGYHYEGKKSLDISLGIDNNPHSELTAMHEIGHFVDHQGIGEAGRFVSGNDPLLRQWREAVDQTDAIIGLRRLQKQRTVMTPDGKTIVIKRGQVSSLLSRNEMVARSYAQYVALRSGSTIIQNQLNEIRADQNDPYRLRQWDDQDFEPIARAFDELFKHLKWTL